MNDRQLQTVFIVDDDEAVRDSITELLESVGLVAQAYDSAAAFLEGYEPDRSGCLVLDVRMAEMSGLVLQQRLKEMETSLPIVMITGHGDVPMAVEAMRNGALDFIQKPYRDQALLDSINCALSQQADRDRTSALDEQFEHRLATLTGREMEIFECIRCGDSSKEIARKLAISPRTVETHRHNLLHKLKVASVKDLLLLLAARKSGN
ncbi:MAG: response regulator transcription factor [Pseudomonadales bacterium]|nr:response regulator transcription factor [Halioglobus sp.]MCP5194617.1 response regulator transcription factor [Pseudomonadales bacterium]